MNNKSSIINFETILEEFHDTLVAGTLRNGDKFSGRLEQFDGVFLKLVNRSGRRVVVRRSQIDSLWGVNAAEVV